MGLFLCIVLSMTSSMPSSELLSYWTGLSDVSFHRLRTSVSSFMAEDFACHTRQCRASWLNMILQDASYGLLAESEKRIKS